MGVSIPKKILEHFFREYGLFKSVLIEWETGKWGPIREGVSIDTLVEQCCRYSPDTATLQLRCSAKRKNKQYPILTKETAFLRISTRDGWTLKIRSVRVREGEFLIETFGSKKEWGFSMETYTVPELRERAGLPSLYKMIRYVLCGHG